MKLVVKNGFIINDNLKFKCSIGYNGLSNKKYEGDGCTPIGHFKIKKILYRPDKINDYKFALDSEVIKKLDGWCDDINSDLYRNDDLYDIVCIIDYNLNPIIRGKGSAIFLHVASEDYSPTQGCIALKKEELIQIAIKLDKGSTITIDY